MMYLGPCPNGVQAIPGPDAKVPVCAGVENFSVQGRELFDY